MNFDFVARPYRWLEYLTFGPWLQRCRLAQLELLGSPKHALVLGDGDGRFLDRMLSRYPRLTAHVIDVSPAMIHLAQQRVQKAGATDRTRFSIADVRSFAPSAAYDLVATHFFLDCLSNAEVDELVLKLSNAITPGGVWLVSEFAVPAEQPLRCIARCLIAGLYFGFRMLTGLKTNHLPDYAAALEGAGFARTHTTIFLRGILRSEIWTASRATDLRATDGTGTPSHLV